MCHFNSHTDLSCVCARVPLVAMIQKLQELLVYTPDPIQLWAMVDFDALNDVGRNHQRAGAIIAYNPNPRRMPCDIYDYEDCKVHVPDGCRVKPVTCGVNPDAYFSSPADKIAMNEKCVAFGETREITCTGDASVDQCKRQKLGRSRYPCCIRLEQVRCEGERAEIRDEAKIVATLDIVQRRWRNRGFFAAQFITSTNSERLLFGRGCFVIKRIKRGDNAVIDFCGTGGQRAFKPYQWLTARGDFGGGIVAPEKVRDAASRYNNGNVRLAMPQRIQVLADDFSPLFPQQQGLLAAFDSKTNYAYPAPLSGGLPLDATDRALLNAIGDINKAFRPFFGAPRLNKTCHDQYQVVVRDSAGNFTCGQRISWLQTDAGGKLSLHEAQLQVGREFPQPNECSACYALNVDDVRNNLATDHDGTYTCGARIEYLESTHKMDSAAAQAQVAREFIAPCGAAHPDTDLLASAPQPNIRACANTGCCGCCLYTLPQEAGTPPTRMFQDFLTLDACMQSIDQNQDPTVAIEGWYPSQTCEEVLGKPTMAPTTTLAPTLSPTTEPPTYPPSDPPHDPITPVRCGPNKIRVHVNIGFIKWDIEIPLCGIIKDIGKALEKLSITSAVGCTAAIAGYWTICNGAMDTGCGPEVAVSKIVFFLFTTNSDSVFSFLKKPFALFWCSSSAGAVQAACLASVAVGLEFTEYQLSECYDCNN